jgi:hypothetical protein
MTVVVTEESAASLVIAEVSGAPVIDLHTHLLPPSHGALCLWGIDELLTYVSRLLSMKWYRLLGLNASNANNFFGSIIWLQNIL